VCTSREDRSASKGDNYRFIFKGMKVGTIKSFLKLRDGGGWRKRNKHSGVTSKKNLLQANFEYWHPELVLF
jgi:hypothetical protein